MLLSSTWAIVVAALPPGAELLPQPQVADAPGGPRPRAPESLLLRPGQKLVLCVRQLLPRDFLSPGERLLNSRPLLVPGDRFLAEVLDGSSLSGVLVGGMVTRVHPPGWFRRPGHVEIQLVQLVELRDGMAAPTAVRVDLHDRQWRSHIGRCLANFYFGFEAGDIGASIGAQLAQGNVGFIMGGAGVGFLVGLGAAALVRGPEGSLEPGDTFEITIGSCSYRPCPRTSPMTIYPPSVPVRK